LIINKNGVFLHSFLATFRKPPFGIIKIKTNPFAVSWFTGLSRKRKIQTPSPYKTLVLKQM